MRRLVGGGLFDQGKLEARAREGVVEVTILRRANFNQEPIVIAPAAG